MKINPIPAFEDNYIWAWINDNEVIIVDPGEAQPVIDYIEENALNLTAILLTHKHDDHIGGVQELTNRYGDVPIYGPEEVSDLATHIVHDDDSFTLWDIPISVALTAGHTAGHISFLIDNQALLCGDALFSGGCGRVFTGDYQAQYDAIQYFKSLNNTVQIYAGHEYTVTNLKFALSIEPDNQQIADALKEKETLRLDNLPTLPSTIEEERRINLFMQANNLDEFTTLRKQRDQF